MFTNCRTYLRWIAVTLILCVPVEPTVLAQSSGPASKVLTVEEAVDFALKNYPAVRASLERVNAAQAGIGLARTNYLPRADMLWQTNRATDNNVTGLVLPQSIIAPISGPVPTSPSNRKRLGKCGGTVVLLGTFRFRIPGSEGRRGARRSCSSRRGSFSDTPRRGLRHGERVSDGSRCPANRARRRG